MAKISRRGRKAPPRTRRKTLAPKKAVAPGKADATRFKQQLAEAHAQQAATAEILKVISESPTDIAPVFRTILEKATRLSGAQLGALWIYEGGDAFRLGEHHGARPEWVEWVKQGVQHFGPPFFRPGGPWRAGQIPDVRETEPYRRREEIWVRSVEGEGVRSMLIVPLTREKRLIGALSIYRREVRLFADNQIELVQSFADQAVIAIQNVRLFNETKEALERQTATAEILRVIGGSMTDTQPVFDAIVKNGGSLFKESRVVLWLIDGDQLHTRASSGESAGPMPVDRGSAIGVCVLDGRMVHLPDLEKAVEEYPRIRQLGLKFGYRSGIYAPLMREGRAIGGISVLRREAGAFDEKEVALLNTFADQAVIAIENVRLFHELEARNNDLAETLKQQTATSEILKVMSGSPTDTQPVFDAITENLEQLVGPCLAGINMLEGNLIQLRSLSHSTAAQADLEALAKIYPLPFDPTDKSNSATRAIVGRQMVEVLDTEASDAPARLTATGRALRFRSITQIPLMREGEAIGTLAIGWANPGAKLTEKQQALAKTFADQAVIAIENVRLFNETREALERQTATAEILNVIASSPADVQPVFDAIAKSAYRLIGGFSTAVARVFDDVLHLVAFSSTDEAGNEALKHAFPMPVSRSKAARTGEPVSISDTEALPESASAMRELARTRGFRSILIVPMLREGAAIGTISVTRREPAEFSNHQVELLKTFADQAVIAIENVRLFNETKEALEQQTASAEILRAISSSPNDIRPIFETLVNAAARFCGAPDVAIMPLDGDVLRGGAACGHFAEVLTRQLGSVQALRIPVTRASVSGRAVVERRVIHVHDLAAEPEDEYPDGRELQRRIGHRTMVAAPLLREGVPLGVIALFRAEVRPFSDKQRALLRIFADQAVIAIENVRLFNETKEALERQTATAEILKVISSSPTNVQPVLDAIVQSAVRLFVPWNAAIVMRHGNILDVDARGGLGLPKWNLEEMAKIFPAPFDPGKLLVALAIKECRLIEVPDTENPPGEFPIVTMTARAGKYRSTVFVPLIREGEGIGAIVLTHSEPGSRLAENQLALAQTFADQAVIAIENVRLFKELESRTEALTRSVGQLTALGEVGRAISSTLDVETVLKTIVSRAVQLTDLDGGSIYEYDERAEEFHLRATENMDEEYLAVLRSTPIRKGEGAVGRAALTGEPTQVPDIQDKGYQTRLRDALIRAGYRAVLVVPLRREEQIIGALSMTRKTPGPFAPEVVELLKTFATQSAMAIQNARLFREIAEKGKQLEQASQHKSNFLASMSHELRTPLNAILGFNEMILGQVYGEVPADMQEPLADIQTSGKHLLRLINNVLDLAKIEAGRMELSLQDYSVHDTVGSVHSTLRPLAAEKGLEFLATVPNDVPLAYGDGGRIAQCLMNLAGNSLKFTKAGKVEISVETRDELLVYKVADTGIGIPPDKIDSLFTEFKQTDATIASEYGGTGLGLSISKKFVEMHGGRIWIESEFGKGSTFIIEIPLRVSEGKAA